LSKNKHEQEDWQQELMKYKRTEPTGTLSTFGHSAMRAAPEAIANLMLKLGLTDPETIEKAIPRNEAYEAGRLQHPLADFGGSAIGFGPLGMGTSTALRTIPLVGRAVEAAAPSLLKRTAVHGLEGATQGALYSPPGKEGEGAGVGALIGGLLGGPGVSLARNIPKAKQHGKNITNIEDLKANHANAQQGYEQQQAIIEALKRQHEEQGAGLTTPEGITRQINAKENQLGALEPNQQIPYENTENLLNYPKGEELIPKAEQNKQMELKDIEHYLKSGTTDEKTTDVHIANEINSSMKKIKQHIQKNYYEPVEEYTKDNYIQLPRTADVKQIEDQLSKISSDPQFKNSPGFEKLKQEMLKQGSGHDLVNANDFVKQWKETKQAAAKARRKGYQEGGEDQAYWQDQAASLKEIADKQLGVLEQHLPKEYFNKLKSADKLWKEEVVPFYGNRIREQAKKFGRINAKNIPSELRGSGMGQEKMLELFLANPKLSRLALAHTYGNDLEGLLSTGPETKPFIEKLPALQGMLARLQGHNRNIEIAKLQHNNLMSNRTRVENAHKELIKQQKMRLEVNQKRLEANQKREKIKSEISNLERKRQNLNHELKEGEIKEREFRRLDDELKSTLKSKKILFSKLGKALTIGTTAIGGYEVLKNILH
jgi:hypothetical protein